MIRNWRRASDERGISNGQHNQFNNKLLKYIHIFWMNQCLAIRMKNSEILVRWKLIGMQDILSFTYVYGVYPDFAQKYQQYKGI